MKIYLTLSVLFFTTQAAFSFETLHEAFTKGTVDGSLQAWQINDWYDGSNGAQSGTHGKPLNRSEYTVGGTLTYESARFYNTSAKVAFISSNIMSQKEKLIYSSSQIGSVQSSGVPSINYNANVLTESYVNASLKKASLKIGNQAIISPLISSSKGVRIFYNTFRGANFIYDADYNLRITGLYINGMQTSTTSIYAPQAPSSAEAINMGFEGLSKVAFGSMANQVASGENNPLSAIAGSYAANDLKAQLWLYNATNMFNSLFLQIDYLHNIDQEFKIIFAGQYMYQVGIGAMQDFFKSGVYSSSFALSKIYCDASIDNAENECSDGVKAEFFALKTGVKYRDLSFDIAYSQTTPFVNAALDGSLIMPWGGSNTLLTSNMIANPTAGGVKAVKFGLEYDFNSFLKGLNMASAYAIYSANSSCVNSYATSGPLGGLSAGLGNTGLTSLYFSTKYQLNKHLSIDFRVEQDALMSQAPIVNNTPTAAKAVIESRMRVKYIF